MKKLMVYGTAVLTLAAAPLFAQAGSTAGQSGSTTAQPGSTTGQPGSTTGQPGSTTGQSGSTQATHPGGMDASMKSSPDHMFVMEAAQGGMAEVALGKLASEKASNDRVKQFGQQMVTDHSKANDELKALAQTKSISIPTDLDAKHKATQDRLSKLSGAAFDRAYIQEMVNDHKKDVADFRKESQSGKDSEVKAWAAKTLPTLEQHNKMVQEISSSLRGGSVGTSGTGAAGTGTGSTGTGGSGSGSMPMPGSGTSGTPSSPGSTGGNPNGTNNPR